MSSAPQTINSNVFHAGDVPYTTIEMDKNDTFMVPNLNPIGFVGSRSRQLIFVVCLLANPRPTQVEACVRAERRRRHIRRVRTDTRTRR